MSLDPLYFTEEERAAIYALVSNHTKELFSFLKHLENYESKRFSFLTDYLGNERKKYTTICQKLVKDTPDSQPP